MNHLPKLKYLLLRNIQSVANAKRECDIRKRQSGELNTAENTEVNPTFTNKA